MTTRVHFRPCTLCEAMCGLRIETDGKTVTSLRGDDDDPFSRGYLCPKATALKDLHEDPDRLRTPMRREGTTWRAIGWDEALDEAARRLHAVQRAHGRDAVATYLGNPTTHNTGAILFGPTFLRALGTKSRFSATSVDQLPHMLVAHWMFGHQLLLPVPDVDRTDFFLVLGANPLASNGSLMTAPGMKHRLEALKARGGRLVVVDPRRTETAERADEHHFIQPGTDALWLFALLHEVLAAPRRPHVLEASLRGLDELERLARTFSPEHVAATTGIGADVTRRLAQQLVSTPRAVVYGRMGTSVQPFGALCAWLINALNIVTGHLDVPGGAMFPMPAFDPRWLPRPLAPGPGSHGRRTTRVRGLPEVGGELPVAAMAEEMLTDGPGRLRALVTLAGNPVLSTPNGAQLDRALAGLEVMISIDPYLNETTRHAHLILPPPSPLERLHFDVVFPMLAVRDVVRHADALFDPGPDARHDWQILLGLGRRLEALRGAGLSASLKWRAMERLGPRGLLDLGLRLGRRGGLSGLTLKKVAAAEHGLDLGPLQPAFPRALQTKDRRIELAPPKLVADVARLEALLSAPRPELVLINRRHTRDNNSWLHNAEKLVSGKPRCTLLMHPSDATARGLSSGAAVTVSSRAGAVTVPLEVSESVMPGVVSLPHGYGHGREGVQLTVATKHAGASVNDVSDELRVDTLSGNAALSGVPVSVTSA
ncbi:MAG: molybdopterin-dependent oxidoreductase [Myxococcaceae bacterium]|jgi:anaerobic selenocysteine-containing dehydrogenase|nr:molybdopterin-dependent oxidoreductase [Myxococcaceae bacterium]